MAVSVQTFDLSGASTDGGGNSPTFSDEQRRNFDVCVAMAHERAKAAALRSMYRNDPPASALLKRADRLEQKLDALAGDYRRSWGPYFQYTSKTRVWGLPLVSVRFGRDRHPSENTLAVGVIAVGNFSVGVVSVGLISAGVFSLGMIAFGLLALGMVSIGYAALGVSAVGGCAAGVAAAEIL